MVFTMCEFSSTTPTGSGSDAGAGGVRPVPTNLSRNLLTGAAANARDDKRM